MPSKKVLPRGVNRVRIHRRAILLCLGIFTMTVSIGVLGLLATTALSEDQSPRTQSTPVSPDTLRADPDELLLKSLQEKEEMANRAQAVKIQGVDNPAPRNVSQSAGLPHVQDPSFRSGIIEGEPGPFYAGDVRVENLWQAEADGIYLQVYAGASVWIPSKES